MRTTIALLLGILPVLAPAVVILWAVLALCAQVNHVPWWSVPIDLVGAR